MADGYGELEQYTTLVVRSKGHFEILRKSDHRSALVVRDLAELIARHSARRRPRYAARRRAGTVGTLRDRCRGACDHRRATGGRAEPVGHAERDLVTSLQERGVVHEAFDVVGDRPGHARVRGRRRAGGVATCMRTSSAEAADSEPYEVEDDAGLVTRRRRRRARAERRDVEAARAASLAGPAPVSEPAAKPVGCEGGSTA